MPLSLPQTYGQWALVTGAAQGLGAEFARQLAAAGMSVVLVDLQKEKLESIATEIAETFSVDVLPVVLDLAADDFITSLADTLAGRDIALLINNAGLASIEYFSSQDEDFLIKQLHVNNRAALLLTHFCLPLMREKRRGAIIFVSSGAGDLSAACTASYSASKAWLLKFSESLWYELKPDGIDVLALQPVSTDTPAIKQQGINSSATLMPASKCVTLALQALGKQPRLVPGYANNFAHQFILRFFPSSWRIALVSREVKRLFGL